MYKQQLSRATIIGDENIRILTKIANSKSTIDFKQLKKEFKVHKHRVQDIQKYTKIKIKQHRLVPLLQSPDFRSDSYNGITPLSKISERKSEINASNVISRQNKTVYVSNSKSQGLSYKPS